jgi:phosphate starvation-inducible PhoH-like protein
MNADPLDKKSVVIDLHGVDQRLLFGQNDMFLRAIETRFVAQIVARGGRVTVEGEPVEVDLVVRLLQDLITRTRAGDHITDQYLNYAISMVRENGRGPAGEISTEALLTSALKKVIKPKTIGQTAYVETCDRNDVVFAIGPAGTGKTYLACAMAVAALKTKRVNRVVSPVRRSKRAKTSASCRATSGPRSIRTCDRCTTLSTTCCSPTRFAICSNWG